jgi:hypothetical protein
MGRDGQGERHSDRMNWYDAVLGRATDSASERRLAAPIIS